MILQRVFRYGKLTKKKKIARCMEAYANCIALNVAGITKSCWEYLFNERELISTEFLVSL